ncbi:glycoside hydrolase family 13 protein [Cellulomonas carbonis]|uniref:Alpha-amylase n=1 Tax=Cellulomonas carbonis T26 TaxID=947969 RepID=A0A0A0BQQ3_9CELL|nr:glycoside hydrolase family 13 protein [Cellulomonas carbonis]KGM10245.1 alpha-amylase [Cellulomonas carbonis T26]GGC01935.1 alpha-glucosidase [Cellulomonas carbonis]
MALPDPSGPSSTSAPEWWRSAVVYQVYPRSFADSDGDGVGDLPGATARLDHLADLGVDAVWLSPFYRSPQADAGYDISDHRDVDPLFGRLEDARELVGRAHALGLRVVVDVVPNHTSDEHPWFRAALASPPGSPERARYVFRDGRGDDGGLPPNNWRSVFTGPAWTRVTETDGSPGQWYLHLFDSRQPDLDWSHPEVRQDMLDTFRFWVDLGVDGFRVDVARGLVKEEGLPDFPEELQHSARVAPDGRRTPLFDQEGVHDVYRSWRSFLDGLGGVRGGQHVLVGEAHLPPERLSRYVRPDEMHQAFNFAFLETPFDARAFRRVVDESLASFGSVGATTTWVLSSHDDVRPVTRFGLPPGTVLWHGIGPDDPQPDVEVGRRRARAAALLMLSLPGSAYVYQGEELGLPEHTTIPPEARRDPTFARSGGSAVGRDGCRVPVPWEADAPAYGFSPTGATWLPQPPEFRDLAADRQRGVVGSTLELYRAALRVRRAHGLGTGTLEWLDAAPDDDVLRYRVRDVVVVVNLGTRPVAGPAGAEVLVASEPVARGTVAGGSAAWFRADDARTTTAER